MLLRLLLDVLAHLLHGSFDGFLALLQFLPQLLDPVTVLLSIVLLAPRTPFLAVL
jgi:hypothetical protein